MTRDDSNWLMCTASETPSPNSSQFRWRTRSRSKATRNRQTAPLPRSPRLVPLLSLCSNALCFGGTNANSTTPADELLPLFKELSRDRAYSC
jgi:hypothetical protein